MKKLLRDYLIFMSFFVIITIAMAASILICALAYTAGANIHWTFTVVIIAFLIPLPLVFLKTTSDKIIDWIF